MVQLIRSPGFNRLAARTHSKVQKMKVQWSGNEEQLRQLKDQERLLKETEEKIKSLDSETNGMKSPPLSASAPVGMLVSAGAEWQRLEAIWGGFGRFLRRSFGIGTILVSEEESLREEWEQEEICYGRDNEDECKWELG